MHIREKNERRATLKVKFPGRMHMNGAASFLQVLARKDKSQSRSTGSIITIMFSPKLDSCLRRGYLTSFFFCFVLF